MSDHVTVADVTMPHRLGHTTVKLVAPDGRPLPGVTVEVEQVSHDFLFGNLLFDYIDPQPNQAELEKWLALYNYGTLPFYWRTYEPEPGLPRASQMMQAAKRFRELGITLKGHTLAWHTMCPQWLLGRPLDAVEQLLRRRITREVSQFAGTIDMWDAINELVIMPVFTAEDNAITPLCRDRGRLALAKLIFDTAQAANPAATLLINDFDLSTAYERLVESLLDAGVSISAIGLQTHMHQGYRGAEEITATLDRFARFGLPLHLTEVSLVSGRLMPPEIIDLNDYQVDTWPSTAEGEQRQAEEIVDLYETALAHPAVAAVTYWGLTDRDSWLGAPIGLLRADGTPKPSYDALLGLIRGVWWVPPTQAVTNEEGEIEVTGFKGVFSVRADTGEPVQFQLGAQPQVILAV